MIIIYERGGVNIGNTSQYIAINPVHHHSRQS